MRVLGVFYTGGVPQLLFPMRDSPITTDRIAHHNAGHSLMV